MDPGSLDKVIHERVRLAVMAALAARGSLSFTELRELLEVTDGNLSVHGAILERHGLVRIVKEFERRKPRTTFVITAKGRKRFEEHVARLEAMLGTGRGR